MCVIRRVADRYLIFLSDFFFLISLSFFLEITAKRNLAAGNPHLFWNLRSMLFCFVPCWNIQLIFSLGIGWRDG